MQINYVLILILSAQCNKENSMILISFPKILLSVCNSSCNWIQTFIGKCKQEENDYFIFHSWSGGQWNNHYNCINYIRKKEGEEKNE